MRLGTSVPGRGLLPTSLKFRNRTWNSRLLGTGTSLGLEAGVVDTVFPHYPEWELRGDRCSSSVDAMEAGSDPQACFLGGPVVGRGGAVRPGLVFGSDRS